MASSQATDKQTAVVEPKQEPVGGDGMDGIQTGGGQNETTPAEDKGSSSGEKQPPPSQSSTSEPPAEQGPPSGGGGGSDTSKSNGENKSPPDKDSNPGTDPNQGGSGKTAPPLSAESINWLAHDYKEGSQGKKRPRPDSAKIDNSEQGKPLFKTDNGSFNYRVPSGLSTENREYDEDLHGDLIGRDEVPNNMKTLALVSDGKVPRYLNQFIQGNALILRIQTTKDKEFIKGSGKPLTSDKLQTQFNDRRWGDVYDILGVAIPGDEDKPRETLAKIDPENLYAFQSRMSLFILIQWTDKTTSFVNRQWWRDNYVPKHMSPADKQKIYTIRYQEASPAGSTSFVDRYRQNNNGFKDYRLLKWAVKYEKMYWEAKHPETPFHSGREKSPSPINDDIAGLREATMPPGTVPPNPNVDVRDTIESSSDREATGRQQRQISAPPQASYQQSPPPQSQPTPLGYPHPYLPFAMPPWQAYNGSPASGEPLPSQNYAPQQYPPPHGLPAHYPQLPYPQPPYYQPQPHSFYAQPPQAVPAL
ncbi:uncharacterized protein NECHADRAFT_88459 [Fusarium vanettenii 77-13-4]|uniref:Uncharacterized protein n=1 Tax=Fusarium vanettenii (strain ATCC MYA-4622 / CBS 123669 / FGSC 9596 / NRRL 45880 / 77-13-4) TaxID=660122 RepID=C7ZBK6_FUSV7|nr:uncharacterized protein NECHADRAFT_88459 [Fusarium vanettenii 77-13-4]EEU38586.1 predicted protein [Fusarium vanettenii 77-13-4]